MTIQVLSDYLNDIARIHATRAGTGEISYYGALAAALNAVGEGLKARVFCVPKLRNRGAGFPDMGLFVLARGKAPQDWPEAQPPERGVIEVDDIQADISIKRDSAQVGRYLAAYGLVLVTNYRDFVLLGRDASGRRQAEGARHGLRRVPEARPAPSGADEAARGDRLLCARHARRARGEGRPSRLRQPARRAGTGARFGVRGHEWRAPVPQQVGATTVLWPVQDLQVANRLADPNVWILDPCCGTGAYLVEVLDRIARTLRAKGEDALLAEDLKAMVTTRLGGSRSCRGEIGLDLASKIDLAALSITVPDGDD